MSEVVYPTRDGVCVLWSDFPQTSYPKTIGCTQPKTRRVVTPRDIVRVGHEWKGTTMSYGRVRGLVSFLCTGFLPVRIQEEHRTGDSSCGRGFRGSSEGECRGICSNTRYGNGTPPPPTLSTHVRKVGDGVLHPRRSHSKSQDDGVLKGADVSSGSILTGGLIQ